MRIFVVNTYYEAFLNFFYAENPDVKQLCYADHFARMMAARFAESDAYAHYFSRAGHDTREVIVNDVQLQRKWAKEHGIRIQPLPAFISNGLNFALGWDWRFLVLKEQVKQYRPDVLYLHEQSILTDQMIADLKPFVRLVVTQTGSPLVRRRHFKADDLILSPIPKFVSYFKERGKRAELIKLCFDPRILEELVPAGKRYDVTFVGGISQVHSRRRELFERLCSNVTIDWYGYGADRLTRGSLLRSCYRGSAWGMGMYQILAASRLTLNSHIDIADLLGANMRLYEATGIGTCVVTDWKKNIRDYFKPDEEVITYRNSDELTEKVKYFLSHETERNRIAEKGQARTLREHTYEKRIPELAAMIKKYL